MYLKGKEWSYHEVQSPPGTVTTRYSHMVVWWTPSSRISTRGVTETWLLCQVIGGEVDYLHHDSHLYNKGSKRGAGAPGEGHMTPDTVTPATLACRNLPPEPALTTLRIPINLCCRVGSRAARMVGLPPHAVSTRNSAWEPLRPGHDLCQHPDVTRQGAVP